MAGLRSCGPHKRPVLTGATPMREESSRTIGILAYAGRVIRTENCTACGIEFKKEYDPGMLDPSKLSMLLLYASDDRYAPKSDQTAYSLPFGSPK